MKGFGKPFMATKKIHTYIYPREISELQRPKLMLMIVIKYCNR